MTVTVLDALGSGPHRAWLDRTLTERFEVRAHHKLRSERFAPCQGCFGCWIEHPGTCKARDAANPMMEDFIASSSVLWLTRPRFGAFDPFSKVALDKSIGLLSPFFRQIHGETHHRARYERYPRWGVLAVGGEVDTGRRECFERMARRNALNMQSYDPWVDFLEEGADEAQWQQKLDEAKQWLARPTTEAFPDLDPFDETPEATPLPPPPRTVAVWVASGKPEETSSSETLGRALMEALERRGWNGRLWRLARHVKLGRGVDPELLRSARESQLLVISTPVYWDSVPSLLLAALAALVDMPSDAEAPRPIVVPIVQSGFPELSHSALSLANIRFAAADANLSWGGHLALGAGGMVGGGRLEKNSKLFRQAEAIDRAAESIDQNGVVAPAIAADFAQVPIGPSMYRTLGQAGWLFHALKKGAIHKLWDRPFAEHEKD